MGDHETPVLALSNPDRFESALAFRPISDPANCPGAKKHSPLIYLGKDQAHGSTIMRLC